MNVFMTKEFFGFTLCLITLLSLASCSSTASRKLAGASEVGRAPESDARFNNKIVQRQFAGDRN